jgi:eukaryotic-like serine/threonine-protein kinase
LAGGYLVYISKGTLFGIRFDPDRLETRGAPVKLLDEQVSYRPTGGSAAFDVSQNGTVLYQSGRETGLLTVQWLNAAGKIEPLLAEPAIYQSLRVSPLGERLAIALVGGPSPDGWAYDLQGNNPTHLGTGLTVNLNLTWNPDGRYLVFHSAVGMSWTRANGAGKPQPLTKSNNYQYPWSFSRDGKRLAYWQQAVSGYEIWTVEVESDAGKLRAGTAELFLKVPNTSSAPSFSPDGRWIAYASTEQGGYQVYVRAFPDNGERMPISNSGGSQPVWSLNGHDLFYRNDEQRIMVATYTVKGDSFLVVGKPRVWSERQLANTGMNPSFDLAPDGRVAALMPAENPGPPDTQGHVTLVMNFFDELRRRVAE